MLAQTLLLTTIFICGGVYLFAVRPLLSFPRLDPPDPRAVTRDAVAKVVWEGMNSGQPSATIMRTITRDPVYRAVAARNPSLRYSIVLDGRTVGMPPVYYAATGLDRMSRAKAEAHADVCLQQDRYMQDGRGWGYFSYYDCPKPRYYEVSGILHPMAIRQSSRWEVYGELLWEYSRSFIQPALATFLICVAILVAHIVTIRRLSRLIGPADGDGQAVPLPERGLPTEVLPLVRAVNRMIGHVADVDQQQRFFLSAAAHEMRTPLTVLRTRLEEIEQPALKTKLVADVRRLTRLVNDLLTLMSVRSRDRPTAQVDLLSCCRRVVAAVEPVAVNKGVTLGVTGGPALVEGDAQLIEIAITNLVTNAVAFSPVGGVVGIAINPAGRLTVTDQGPGIADADIPHLFEPFKRFTKTPGGYGLGLTIVKAIADLHEAKVTIESKISEGLSFSMTFKSIVVHGIT